MENEEIKGQSSDEPTIQELKNASIIFAQALTSILKDKEGIVVDISESVTLSDTIKKVIVIRNGNQINIFKCEEDIPNGSMVHIEDESEE